jgi:uncharacterized surface protein with fasciclin (FAS1) repeats
MAISFTSASLVAENDPDVGGAAMHPTKNIVQNALNSKGHTTLVAAVKVNGVIHVVNSVLLPD